MKGKSLGNLPIGLWVGSHTARVSNGCLERRCMLLRRVLPTISALQVEIRIARQLAITHSQAIVLAHVAIATDGGGVLH